MTQPQVQLIDEFLQDVEWFYDHLLELQARYDEQFVAIKGGEVVAAGPKFVDVLAKLRQAGLNPEDTVVKLVSKAKRIL